MLDYFVPCHSEADCVNTIGSYKCQCWEGYEGDGFNCADANECDDGTSGCHSKANCKNTAGSFECSCKTGFTGDGFNCTDIDECKEGKDERCSKNSICINTPGDYECECLEGYFGDGYCEDVDECNAEVIPCDEHATCSNSMGSYSCECDQGWRGNGTVCADINECEEGAKCAGNATCYNSDGSYRCKCNKGFKGNGAEKCHPMDCIPPAHCEGQLIASWWSRSPYISIESNGKAKGLFKEILELILAECCNNCTKLEFSSPYNDSAEVEQLADKDKTDFALPLYGAKGQTKLRKNPFLPIVESPGIAFFIKEQPPSSSPLLQSLGGSWPILVITLLLAALSGVIMWFLDTVHNPHEFPHSFISGAWEGFWWAFITMTTVGYGDKAPRSFFARIFGILWILIGLVIISTFTATITTVLTATSLTNEAKLYGTKVGTLQNSEEYRLGVKRNADVKSYASVPDIIDALKKDEIQGALMDTYIAGEFQDDMTEYKMQQVLEYVFVYGVALARDARKLEDCFNKYIETEQSKLFTTISKVVKPPKEKRSTDEVQSSATLFDAQTSFFRFIIIGGLLVLFVLLIIGFTWDWLFWRQKSKKILKILHKAQIGNGNINHSSLNGWETSDIIDYQKKAFKNDISDLKNQIADFSDVWVKKLDIMESRHNEQLERVQRWLGKSSINSSTLQSFPDTRTVYQNGDFLTLYSSLQPTDEHDESTL